MRTFLWISALLLATCAAGAEDLAPTPGTDLPTFSPAQPIELTDTDFEASISDGRVWSVMFYAPWCGHCKRMLPVWEKLAKSPTLTSAEVQVAKIDGSAGGKGSMETYVVQFAGLGSFPTILRFHQGKVWAHSGDRKLQNLIDFSLKPSSPAITPPGPIAKAFSKLTGYYNQFQRWLSGQSTTVVVICLLIMMLALLCLGFLMGYYWREWKVECWVNMRWGSEGRFYPFALVPIDPNVKMIRKDRAGTVVPLKQFSPGDGSEVFCQVEHGKQYWMPSMQQLSETAQPTPPEDKPKAE